MKDSLLAKYVLVLDMDETLLRAFEGSESYNRFKKNSKRAFSQLEGRRLFKTTVQDVMEKRGKGVTSMFWFVKRPGLDNFLMWAQEKFAAVVIWSAGKKEYVYSILDVVFSDLKPPDLILTYDDIVYTKTYSSKPLEKVFERLPIANIKNTIIVDDVLGNFYRANPFNGILIPEYLPNSTGKSFLEEEYALDDIIDWFENMNLNTFKDIRIFDKRTIFENFPIAEKIQPPPIDNASKFSVPETYLEYQSISEE